MTLPLRWTSRQRHSSARSRKTSNRSRLPLCVSASAAVVDSSTATSADRSRRRTGRAPPERLYDVARRIRRRTVNDDTSAMTGRIVGTSDCEPNTESQRRYPKTVLSNLPRPPLSFADATGRAIEIRLSNDGDRGNLVEMNRNFAFTSHTLGIPPRQETASETGSTTCSRPVSTPLHSTRRSRSGTLP